MTEAPHQKDKILPNFYILDSFPSLLLLPKCLEQSKVKGNFVWCGQYSLGKLCTVSFAFWVLNFRSYIWSVARASEKRRCPYTWFSRDNLINNNSTNLFRNLLYCLLMYLFKAYNTMGLICATLESSLSCCLWVEGLWVWTHYPLQYSWHSW